MKEKSHCKINFNIISLYLFIITFILDLVGTWPPIANFYVDYIYPIINMVVGTITNPFPFALGEIIMYLGALLILSFVILSILFLFLHKKIKYKNFYKRYSSIFLCILMLFLFVYSTNWFIPFSADVLKVGNTNKTEFTADEVARVRAMYVDIINEATEEIARDDNGDIIYTDYVSDVKKAMKDCSDEFPRLKGHYSDYKPALCSDVLEWMGIGGYNYIYTMEPTVNKYCDKMYMPSLYAHELAHHKGYYKENEANFLEIYTLCKSNNPLLRISGANSAYYYLDSAYFDALINKYINVEDTKDLYEKYILPEYNMQPQLSNQHCIDEEKAYEMRQDYYEENVNQVAEEHLEEVSEEIATSGWEIQGDILAENSYDGVTLMLLQYYCP